MPRIPLAEIPNAPVGINALTANPQFPTDRVGDRAIAQINRGYEGMMVDMEAAGAMGKAAASIGYNMTQVANAGMNAIDNYSKVVERQSTIQFLTNLTEIQGGMKTKMAGMDPTMLPVAVKDTYRDKNGNLNPALFSGVSPMGRRFVEAEALRAEAKDMGEASLTAQIATLERDEGRKLTAFQTMVTSGKFADASVLNSALLDSRTISPEQFANNEQTIKGAQAHQVIMATIGADPMVIKDRLEKAYMEGKPLDEIKDIPLDNYPKYIKAAEFTYTLRSAQEMDTITDLIDSRSVVTLDALRSNPIYKTLGTDQKTALERRLTNNTAGTPQAELAIKEAANRLASFPSTDAPAREMLEMVTWATANIPDPHLKPVLDGLQNKVAEMAQNGGSLKPNSDLERYVATKLNVQASMGMFGPVPKKQSGDAQTPEFVQQTLVIETAKMDAMQKFRAAGIKSQADADNFLAQLLLPAQAKNAFKNDPDFGTRFKQFLFGKPDPNAPATPKPAKTPAPTPQGSPVGNETSMFDPDVNDLVAGAYTFKVTDQTRDALPASTPTARQVSLDFNDASSPTARGVEIIIPNDATEEERAIAKAYVDRTTEWFRSKGIDVPNRGVRTAKENGRGTRGRFHTEPFFVGDADALAAMQSDPQGYAQVLASTLGRIEGVTFIAPHKATDPGASRGKLNERDFAKSVIIPELRKLVNA